MCLILNPTIILSTVLAQTVNEFIPAGVVLISLMFFVIVSISINIYNGIKKFRLETKMIEEQKLKGTETVPDVESKSVNPSKVILFIQFNKSYQDLILKQVKLIIKLLLKYLFLLWVLMIHLLFQIYQFQKI